MGGLRSGELDFVLLSVNIPELLELGAMRAHWSF